MAQCMKTCFAGKLQWRERLFLGRVMPPTLCRRGEEEEGGEEGREEEKSLLSFVPSFPIFLNVSLYISKQSVEEEEEMACSWRSLLSFSCSSPPPPFPSCITFSPLLLSDNLWGRGRGTGMECLSWLPWHLSIFLYTLGGRDLVNLEQDRQGSCSPLSLSSSQLLPLHTLPLPSPSTTHHPCISNMPFYAAGMWHHAFFALYMHAATTLPSALLHFALPAPCLLLTSCLPLAPYCAPTLPHCISSSHETGRTPLVLLTLH